MWLLYVVLFLYGNLFLGIILEINELVSWLVMFRLVGFCNFVFFCFIGNKFNVG